jgi:hypothetical protein
MGKEMTELKRCPFCNSEPETKSVFIQGVANHKNYFVSCPHCEFRLRNRRIQESAIDEWNIRPIEDELNARIKELEIQLRAYMALAGYDPYRARE